MLFAVLVFIIVVSIIHYLVTSYWNKDGPPAITVWDFITGKYKMEASEFYHSITEWGKQFDGIFKVGTFYVVDTKELAQEVYITQDPIFADRVGRDFLPSHEVMFDSQDIVQKDYNPTLQMLRKSCYKSMQMYGQGLETFEAVVRDELVELLDYLDEARGEATDPSAAIETSLINIICTLLFGDKFDYNSEEVKIISKMNETALNVVEYGKAQELFCNPLAWLLLKLPIQRYTKIRRNIAASIELRDHAFSSVINKYMEQARSGGGDSVLASLVADQDVYGRDVFTDQLVKGILLDLIMAGASTTRATLRGLVYTLASQPEVQERVFSELMTVTGGSRLARIQDREETPYTTAVILEQLRFQTVSPIGIFRVSSKETTLKGFTIPKRSVVSVNLWAMHHNPNYWEKPDEFYPEHFLDKHGKLLTVDVYKAKGYFPFGAGRRVCLGESLAKSRLFLMFSALVQRFHILPPEGVKLPKANSKSFVMTLVSDAPQFQVRFVRRD